MVIDYVSETLSQSHDSTVSSTSEVELNTKAQELHSENIKISEFTMLQQDELLATLYSYHSYFGDSVQLCIICTFCKISELPQQHSHSIRFTLHFNCLI